MNKRRSANVHTANFVVRYNPGQYIELQEKFFHTKKEAEKFVQDFKKLNPAHSVKWQIYCCRWDTETKTAKEIIEF